MGTMKTNPIKVKEIYKFVDSMNEILKNKDMSLKSIQTLFNTKIKPNCEIKWNGYFDKEILWRKVWGILHNNFATRKSNQLSWKIIHKIVYTEEKLQKIGRPLNGLCHFAKIKPNL